MATRSLSSSPMSLGYAQTKIFWVTTFILLAVYAFTTSGQLLPNETSEIIMAPSHLGLFAAPGYPAFSVFGFIFSKVLWILEPAAQIHYMNAVFSAGAAGILALITYQIFALPSLAVLSGLAFGLTSLSWGLATSSEVIPFHLLLTNLLWLLLLGFKITSSRRQLWAFCFILGLAFTHCFTLTLLNAVGLIVLWISPLHEKQHALDPIARGKAAGFFLLGLAPWIVLFIDIQSAQNLSFVSVEFKTGDTLWSYLTGNLLPASTGTSSSLFDTWQLFMRLNFTFAKDLGLFFLVVLFGIYMAFKAKFLYRWPLLVAFLTTLFTLSISLAVSGGTSTTEFLIVQHLAQPIAMYLTLFMVYGIFWIHEHYKVPPSLYAGLGILGLMSQVLHAYPLIRVQNETSAEAVGTALLSSLPQNATLVLCGLPFASLRYLQAVKGLRGDVKLYQQRIDKGRIVAIGPLGTPGLPNQQFVDELIRNSPGPTYLTDCKPFFQGAGFQVINKGLAYQIVNRSIPEQAGLSLTASTVKTYLDTFGLSPLVPAALRTQRQRASVLLLSYAFQNEVISAESLTQIIKDYRLENDVAFLVALAGELAYGDERSLALSMNYFQQVEYDELGKADPEDVAVFCRILIASSNLQLAQVVCPVPEQASRTCNGDLKYNMGRAFWKRKDKSLRYLREAARCAPHVPVILEAIANREKEP